MLEKDEGIILRTTRRGETSKDLVFLGRQSGKIRLIAKGALSAKSSFRGQLEAGNHVDIVYYFKEGRTLFYLREVYVRTAAATGRRSLDDLAVMLAALELLDGVCVPASPDQQLVDTALAYIHCPAAADPLFMFLVFELGLLEVLGVLPDFFACSECGRSTENGRYDSKTGESRCREHAGSYSAAASDPVTISPKLLGLIGECFRSSLDNLQQKEVDRKLRKDLGKIIHRTYTYHVQGYRLPDSLKLLK
jgi:DNA repair protein RecO (recombination protein O)